LVERRKVQVTTPPDGIERRSNRPPPAPQIPTLTAAPLWPFRVAALAGAFGRIALSKASWHDRTTIVCAVVVAVYAAIACIKPVPYRAVRSIKARVAAEQLLHIAVVVLTGGLSSPFAVCLVPTGMLAGFAAGGLFSVELGIVAIIAATAKHADQFGLKDALPNGRIARPGRLHQRPHPSRRPRGGAAAAAGT
jgi:hypothetical protein